jgi:hypothetical protein
VPDPILGRKESGHGKIVAMLPTSVFLKLSTSGGGLNRFSRSSLEGVLLRVDLLARFAAGERDVPG